jgi:hypothetical protein
MHQSHAIAYIYFDFKNQEAQTVDKVVRTLLKQLLLHSDSIPPDLGEVYDDCHSRPQSPDRDFFNRQLVSTAATFSSVYILLDALDECTSATLEDLIILIRKLKGHGIKVFCTFRPNLIDLGERLNIPTIQFIGAHDEDIRNYLSIRLNKEWRHAKSLREKVIDPLVKGAHGKSISYLFIS